MAQIHVLLLVNLISPPSPWINSGQYCTVIHTLGTSQHKLWCESTMCSVKIWSEDFEKRAPSLLWVGPALPSSSLSYILFNFSVFMWVAGLDLHRGYKHEVLKAPTRRRSGWRTVGKLLWRSQYIDYLPRVLEAGNEPTLLGSFLVFKSVILRYNL